MSVSIEWLTQLDTPGYDPVDGSVSVEGFDRESYAPEDVSVLERAAEYGAKAVFFEAGRAGRPNVAQALIFVAEDGADDQAFADLHRRLWSWGGVPLVYRVTRALVQLFRCGHKADFDSKGKLVLRPYKTLEIAAKIADDPWWDAERLRNGTLWDDPEVCGELLSGDKSAQKTLIKEVKALWAELGRRGLLPEPLRRKLVILSLLVAYLEARQVFEDGYMANFKKAASRFFEVLADGQALTKLLADLENRFNGNVFCLSQDDQCTLETSNELSEFARLIEAKQEASGQMTLWERYSFADLPVELISHIYQLFVDDKSVAVYTPPFLVRLMLGEVLDGNRIDRLHRENEVILDPSCGSGVFLVEAYKRLVLYWRSRNNWEQPDAGTLKHLLHKVHGVDVEAGAIELASFSLCLALCDALKPEQIRASVKLFPALEGQTLHKSCFFDAVHNKTIQSKIGVIIGNPPFASKLTTAGAKRAYNTYQTNHGESVPDKQVAYLFLDEAMRALAPGGVLAMLQQYNFLYNQQSLNFRRRFLKEWDIREILDFISVRGLFQKGSADTKVIVVIAEAQVAPEKRQILHATFRRSGRVDAEQGFDLDYYDMHWLSRELLLANDAVWRCDLLGGGRILSLIDRLKTYRTLRQYAEHMGWDYGEGFIEGASGISRNSEHVIGHPHIPSEAIGENGIDSNAIVIMPEKPIEGPRTEKRFTPPMLLVREQYDLPSAFWTDGYLTYKNKIVGFCAPPHEVDFIRVAQEFLKQESVALRTFAAANSVRLFTQKATTLSAVDIFDLPYPEDGALGLSQQELTLAEDVVHYYRDFIRLGSESKLMTEPAMPHISLFTDVFAGLIRATYKDLPFRSLEPQFWPGIICQPFVFGDAEVAWHGVEELKEKLDKLLVSKSGSGLNITRIARIYDGPCIYLLKPDRLRYWLRSIALRDADETLADLWDMGY